VNAAVFVLRLLIGGLLLGAGLLKIGHAPELAAAVASFRLLPPAVVAPLARVAGWVATIQFVAYAAAIGSAVARHIPANCGCFGPADSAPADWPHVAFDLGLALASAVIAYGAPGALALDRRLRAS
jgi:uncharacterized membrane protein YphA (DoxX/SURF4 family)